MSIKIDDLKIDVDKNGIFTIPITDLAPATGNYTKTIDLKAFLTELGSTLYEKGYKDMLFENKEKYIFFENIADKMEFANPKTARVAQMYEWKFVKINHPGGKNYDYEIYWNARKPLKSNDIKVRWGWFEFKMNLQLRVGKDEEVIVGNSKRVLQSGKWEFRNSYEYKNSVFRDFLNKIPIVKDSEFLKKFYISHIYKDQITTDIKICKEKEMADTIFKVISKYMT